MPSKFHVNLIVFCRSVLHVLFAHHVKYMVRRQFGESLHSSNQRSTTNNDVKNDEVESKNNNMKMTEIEIT